jgi:hypothetical protein
MQRSRPVSTAGRFSPLSRELVHLLEGLDPGAWELPASTRWRVRDVAAHILDGDLRRLSFERDGRPPPAPAEGVAFPAFLGGLNEAWVQAMDRLSPMLLTGLLAWTGPQLATFYRGFTAEALAAPAFFPVSWAGDNSSPGWLDVGREYLERWHHQQQIRDAVGAPPLTGPEWLEPLLAVGVHAFRGALLPLAAGEAARPPGTRLQVEFRGAGGGEWVVERREGGWELFEGTTPQPDARLALEVAEAWRLLLRGESPLGGEREGDPALLGRALRARAVVTGAEPAGVSAPAGA